MCACGSASDVVQLGVTDKALLDIRLHHRSAAMHVYCIYIYMYIINNL